MTDKEIRNTIESFFPMKLGYIKYKKTIKTWIVYEPFKKESDRDCGCLRHRVSQRK